MRQRLHPGLGLAAKAVYILFFTWSRQPKTLPEDPSIWKKIRIDFKQLDADGLRGPTDGKVAVNYEFCLPAQKKYWQRVRKMDKTAQKQAGAYGRAGCRAAQWLVIGSTHQAHYQRVLYELASLPYIERIEETFWE